MSEFDPETFQGEVMQWTMKNFKNSQQHQPLLGLAEELGELYKAVCGTEAKEDDVVDAAGDLMIFLAHYCGMNGYDFFQIISNTREKYNIMFWDMAAALAGLVAAVGRLAHAHLKQEQGIRKDERHRDNAKEAIGEIVGMLRIFMEHNKLDLTEAVGKTWDEVKKRDWKTDPINGGAKKKESAKSKMLAKVKTEIVEDVWSTL